MIDNERDFSKLNIWVVEDDSASIDLISRILQALKIENFKVTTQVNRVIEAMQTGVQIDIAFIDVHIKEDDGYELLAKIRANPEYAQTKNIIFSASSGPLGVVRAQAARADGFISKPLTFDKVARALETVMDNKHFWD